MKTKLFTISMVLFFIMINCKKSDNDINDILDKKPTNNSFTLNDESYKIDKGFFQKVNRTLNYNKASQSFAIVLSSEFILYDSIFNDFIGKGNVIAIGINSSDLDKIKPGTYILDDEFIQGTPNTFAAGVTLNYNSTNYSDEIEYELNDNFEGKLDIKKIGEEYEITFNFVVEMDIRVKGFYKGKLQNAIPSNSPIGLNKNLSYGQVKGQDGYNYATIKIGTQEWMAENLKTSIYANGDSISKLDQSQWKTSTIGYYDYSEFKIDNNRFYGKLYNWYAVNDQRNLCPTGWHIPTNDDWNQLIEFLGGEEIAGRKLKSAQSYFGFGVYDANNSSGFSALPAGKFYDYYGTTDLTFNLMHSDAYFWSSTQNSSKEASYIHLTSDVNGVYQDKTIKNYGFSVRCIKD